jgi:predicted nuclease with TOPRIM domain
LYHCSNTARSADKIKLAELEKKNSALYAEKAVLMEEAVQLKDNLEMLKKNVDELEKKRKLQRVLTCAYDVVQMLNRAGWNAQTEKVKRIKAIIDEPLFNETPNDDELDEDGDVDTN